MIFSSAICFLQKLLLSGANLPQTGLNCYEFIKKRWNTNIDFSAVIGLLRLAAQKEGAKAQDGLLRRTNCISSIHKSNYTRGEKLLQHFFAEFRGLGQGGYNQTRKSI
jgi:hypothetical protein